MNPIQAENAVFKYAAGFLPKWKIDIVAQFADRLNIYAMNYAPISDEWAFSDGEIYTTPTILSAQRILTMLQRMM